MYPKLPSPEPVPPVAKSAVIYHYDIIDTASKKRAHPFLLCAVVGPAGTYTSADNVTAVHTAASLNNHLSALC